MVNCQTQAGSRPLSECLCMGVCICVCMYILLVWILFFIATETLSKSTFHSHLDLTDAVSMTEEK